MESKIINSDCLEGAVANKLKRNFIGIDLNPDYCIMAQERIKKENPPCEGGLQQFKID